MASAITASPVSDPGAGNGGPRIRVLVFQATVEELYAALPPETDLRSEVFYRAVIERALERGVLEVETDGVDVAVFAAPLE